MHLYLFYLISIRFGSARVVISDQGREFLNGVNKQLFEITGTEHRVSTAYHPQTKWFG